MSRRSARRRLTFDSAHSHPVDDIVRQAEGDLLGYIEGATAIEEAVEVDVYRVTSRAVEEDVLAVSVAKSVGTAEGKH